MWLLSPTESKAVSECAPPKDWIYSEVCERKGADILISTKVGFLGIQRKSIPHDFLASIDDGRLARETTLLRDCCAFSWLVREGEFKYDNNGRVLVNGHPHRFTEEHIRHLLWSIELTKGVHIETTKCTADTWRLCSELEEFLNQKRHLSLFNRPNVKGVWGIPSEDESKRWFLQGLPTVGVGIADNILKKFKKIPMKWACTMEELREVEMIGVARASKIWKFLE